MPEPRETTHHPDRRAALGVLGLAATLGLVAGLFRALDGILAQRYIGWGMYDLAARAALSQAVRAIGVALLVGAIFAVGGWLRRRGRAAAWTVAGLGGGLVVLAAAWWISHHTSGGPASLKSPSVIAAVALAALLVGLGFSGLAWRRLARALPGGWGRVGALAVGSVLLLGGALSVRAGLRADNGPNVVLIGVDTLRADHLGVYGYARDTSPNLDAWAERATVFENCIASTPRTTQSLASIMTGRYPHRTGVRYLRDVLPDRELALAEVLKNAGYRTIAVVATGIPYKKLDQGFDVVIDTPKEFSAEETVDRALEALSRTSGKYFLYVFFRDPHMPYGPPELVFDRDYQGPAREKLTYQGSKARTVFLNSFDERLREHAIALYDSEIHYTDRQIARLMAAVEARSRDNITLFFADHGESLGEHDYYYDHGDLLYQPSLRIPCIIEGIDFGARRVSEVVRSVDLMPTLLAALGIEIDDRELDGVDLASDHPPLEAYSETGRALLRTAFRTGRRHLKGLPGRLRSLVYGRTKLVYVPKAEGVFEFELYDLDGDPLELHDLAADSTGREEIDRMKRRLLSWVDADRVNWTKPEEDLTEEEANRLRRLGYL